MIPSLVRSAGNRSGRDTSQMRAVHVLQLAALTWVVRAVALHARLYLIGGLDGVTDNPTTTVRVFNLQ